MTNLKQEESLNALNIYSKVTVHCYTKFFVFSFPSNLFSKYLIIIWWVQLKHLWNLRMQIMIIIDVLNDIYNIAISTCLTIGPVFNNLHIPGSMSRLDFNQGLRLLRSFFKARKKLLQKVMLQTVCCPDSSGRAEYVYNKQV